MVPEGSDLAPYGSHMCLLPGKLCCFKVLLHPAAAPCCRRFTVTDVDLIFQKVRARLLPGHELAKHCGNTQPSTCDLTPGQDKGRAEDEL